MGGKHLVSALLSVVAATLSVMSLITAVGTDEWWVRLLDFPRIQLTLALLLAGSAAFALGPRGKRLYATIAICAVATAYNGYKLAPYTPVWPEAVNAGGACPAQGRVRILAVNVKRGNEQSAPLRDLLGSLQPDIFLAMETDAWWDRELDAVAGGFANNLKEVASAQNHFGIHLMSKLERVSGKILYLEDKGVPTVHAMFRLDNGETFEFLGLHPKPPSVFQDSTVRDAQLLEGARMAAQSPEPTVVAGDLNSTPWEGVVRGMIAQAGLLDPRIGRGFFNTYTQPGLGPLWPIDHILMQQPFRLSSFMRGPDIGSDHRPVIAELCLG